MFLPIHFNEYIVGSSIPHIYFKDYSLKHFDIPHLSEQTKIATLLSSIDKVLNTRQNEITLLKKYKSYYLNKIFS